MSVKDLLEKLRTLISDEEFETLHRQLVKVSNLQAEIEDLEDDLDDAQSECEQLREQLFHTQDTLHIKVNSLEEGIKCQERLKVALMQVSESNKLLEDVQGLVSDVLTAKAIDYSEANKHVNDFASFLKDVLKPALSQEAEILKELFPDGEFEALLSDQEIERWRLINTKTWLADKKKIAIVGEFSAGKTSIVNRILSQDCDNVLKLPVSTEATTAIPTYISGLNASISDNASRQASYTVYTPSNERKEISENTFKKVNKQILSKLQGVSALIKYFVMEYNNVHLKGLSILDTPGFNSNDSEDALRTIEVINECDALFWIIDVNSGTINRTSLSVIKGHLNKPLYVVINKVDTKSKSEVDDVERLIRKTLKEYKLPFVDVIRFAQKGVSLDVLMKPIHAIEVDDSHNVYLNTVSDKLQLVCGFLGDIYRRHNKKAIEENEKYEELINYYIDSTNETWNHICEAISIPSLTYSVWNGDRYIMSVKEYEKFEGYIERARKMLETSYEITASISETSKGLGDIYAKRGDWLEKVYKFEGLLYEFNNLRKSLKRTR